MQGQSIVNERKGTDASEGLEHLGEEQPRNLASSHGQVLKS